MTTQGLPKLSFLSAKSVAVLATILGVPFLSFYWMALARFVPDTILGGNSGWLMPLSLVLYVPFAFFAYILFGNLYAYILVTIVGITAAITGLIQGRQHRLLAVWLLALIFAIVAFPFVYRYRPALVAATGYRMQLVTDPGFWGGIVRASQNLIEQTPCEYELLGWSADGKLYYQATCDGETQIWQYSPARPGSCTRVSGVPAKLSASTISKDAVLEMVRASDVRPEEYELATRRLLLKSQGVVSLDGYWTAIVTQHIYGTQDVIVLTDAK